MKLVQIAFAFVLLVTFDNALPAFGHCSFMKAFCEDRRCTTVFYKDLQKDPSANCSVKYRTMLRCMVNVYNDCERLNLTQSQVDTLIRAIANNSYRSESHFCLRGSFRVRINSPDFGLHCTSTYDQNASLCGKTFHEKFVANRSDPSLCSELAKAKKCIGNLLASECTYDYDWELLNETYGDYNPFCANNRDPGATGNDQCHAFLPSPTQSTTRPPTRSTQFSTRPTQSPTRPPTRSTQFSTRPTQSPTRPLTTPFFFGQSTLPGELSDANKRKNKSEIIVVKQYILLFVLGLYYALV